MIGFKKRDTKDLFKVIARQHGISVSAKYPDGVTRV